MTDTEKQRLTVDALESLLEEQIRLARKDRIREVEKLSERAGALVEDIAKTGISGQPEFKDKCEHIAELYRKLTLILTAHKEQTGQRIRRIDGGKKTLEKYRSNI